MFDHVCSTFQLGFVFELCPLGTLAQLLHGKSPGQNADAADAADAATRLALLPLSLAERLRLGREVLNHTRACTLLS